jgi:prepilin-type N-terminal cleavage/methylation domain-containing protein
MQHPIYLILNLKKAPLSSSLYSVEIKSKTSDINTCSSVAAQKPCQPGFSLVELLVVIAIIALLMSMILPSLEKARSAAMRIKCGHNLKQAYLAMHMYLESNEDVYPCSQDPQPEPPPGYWLWMGRWRSFVEPYLSTKITEDNPSVLLCPQDALKMLLTQPTTRASVMPTP